MMFRFLFILFISGVAVSAPVSPDEAPVSYSKNEKYVGTSGVDQIRSRTKKYDAYVGSFYNATLATIKNYLELTYGFHVYHHQEQANLSLKSSADLMDNLIRYYTDFRTKGSALEKVQMGSSAYKGVFSSKRQKEFSYVELTLQQENLKNHSFCAEFNHDEETGMSSDELKDYPEYSQDNLEYLGFPVLGPISNKTFVFKLHGPGLDEELTPFSGSGSDKFEWCKISSQFLPVRNQVSEFLLTTDSRKFFMNLKNISLLGLTGSRISQVRQAVYSSASDPAINHGSVMAFIGALESTQAKAMDASLVFLSHPLDQGLEYQVVYPPFHSALVVPQPVIFIGSNATLAGVTPVFSEEQKKMSVYNDLLDKQVLPALGRLDQILRLVPNVDLILLSSNLEASLFNKQQFAMELLLSVVYGVESGITDVALISKDLIAAMKGPLSGLLQNYAGGLATLKASGEQDADNDRKVYLYQNNPSKSLHISGEDFLRINEDIFSKPANRKRSIPQIKFP